MNNENRNDEAVSPVIATILMVAITVVLAGVLYVWASSLAGDSTGDGLDTFQFDGRDASGTLTDDVAVNDELVYVKMTTGSDLNWANVAISVTVDDGASIECTTDSASTDDCIYTKSDDKTWDTPFEIMISEHDGSNICAPSGEKTYCTLEVTITKKGVGDEDSKVLQTIKAIAEA